MTHAMLTVRCDTCSLPMYRTDGQKVLDIEEGGRMQPITVVVNDVKMVFCSKSCAARWLIKQPVESLRKGGYPVF